MLAVEAVEVFIRYEITAMLSKRVGEEYSSEILHWIRFNTIEDFITMEDQLNMISRNAQ